MHLLIAINKHMEQFRVQDLLIGIFIGWLQVLSGNGNQPFQVKLIGTHQQVMHLLHLVGFIAHIGQDDQAGFVGTCLAHCQEGKKHTYNG